MFTAILTACLAAGPMSAPVACRSHEMLIYQPMPTVAFMEAQIRAAEWMEKHPGMVMRSLKVLRGRAA